MVNPKKVGQNQKTEPINIYCIKFKYTFADGHTEQSQSKFCGQSEDDAVKAISQMLGICRTSFPESIVKVSFDIEGYRRSTFESHCGPDICVPDVVAYLLRYDDEGVSI